MTFKPSKLDYTTVLGVDKKHLEQLKMTWPTWVEHKPEILKHPMVVFFDSYEVNYDEVKDVVIKHPNLLLYPWPSIDPKAYHKDSIKGDKWTNPQRYKMLSGFVHVPPRTVKTKYWLKIDVDTVAVGNDNWVDSEWFLGNAAIISHPWGFTKPPDQMLLLDQWIANIDFVSWVSAHPPLNLKPKEGFSRVKHKRIISWCSFFHTGFTKLCSTAATKACGNGLLPVRSQDGFMWYMAKRAGYPIRRVNMKSLGWKHCSSMKTIKQSANISMGLL